MYNDITLNIHYTIPNSLWDKLEPLIHELTEHGIGPSVEPGGLQLYGEIPQAEWDMLIDNFCEKASEILGFAVGDANGEFECVPFE